MDEGSHSQITKLLRETVLMLCKNGVCFERQLRVQGLIGVTVDDGIVFLVHINEDVSADGSISAYEPVNNKRTVKAPASSRQLHVDANEQRQAEVRQLPKTSESSTMQYLSVKQELETSGTISELCGESHTAADVPASVSDIATLPSVQESEFGNQVLHDNDVIYVDSASGQTSCSSNLVKPETAEIWNPYSVLSTADQQDYGSSDCSGRQLCNALGSRALIKGDTAQYNESLGNEHRYRELGLTHYLNTSMSQNLLQSTPNQLARKGGSQRKMVFVLYIPTDSIKLLYYIFAILHSILDWKACTCEYFLFNDELEHVSCCSGSHGNNLSWFSF